MVINMTHQQIVDAMNEALDTAGIVEYDFGLEFVAGEYWARLYASSAPEWVFLVEIQIQDETSVRELRLWLVDILMRRVSNAAILALEASLETEFSGV